MLNVYLFALLFGAISGYFLLKGAVHLIHKKVDFVYEHWLVNQKKSIVFWTLFCGVAWLQFIYTYGLSYKTLELIFVFSICLLVAVTDTVIRKIPNELVLLVLFGSALFKFCWVSKVDVVDHILGLIVGGLIFLAPFILGKQAGGGDVKYAASIGFCLGLYYSLIAFVIMSILIFLFSISMIITKKANFKTKIAMGPYMSMGFITAFILLKAAM